MTDRERLEEVEQDLNRLQKAWAQELAEMSKKRGFDMYAPKWEKKMQALANKYADLIYPLKAEQNRLADKLNDEEEAARRNKYVDPE